MGRLQIALYFLIVCMGSASMGFACKEAERNALLKIKHSFSADPYNFLGSWVGEDCCSWKGVGCDNVTSNVIKLGLNSTGLVAREVNPALLEFKHHLRYLDLTGICFNGSRIPEFLGEMRQLKCLYLSGACFTGKVPHHLGNLSHLVDLDLGWNDPGLYTLEEENSLEWVSRLRNLQDLVLNHIDLSKAHDSLSVLFQLPSLVTLRLRDCRIGNSHLVMRNSTAYSSPLQNLVLRENLFNGSIPYFLQNLSFLTSLELSFNQLGFSIPSWLLDKRNLEYLSLKNNRFNGIEGGVMNKIGCLCGLQHLDMSHNQLRDYVSKSHVNFSGCSKYDLKRLNLNNNNKIGHMPIIESFSSLVYLDLSYNRLSTILNQVTLAKFSSLEFLDISSNSISFDLPSNWTPPFQLQQLFMSSCKINTPFPKWLLSLKYMCFLDLSGTGIFGHLPNNIDTAMPYLEILRLARNRIDGSIPRSLCEIPNLSSINLKNNRLSGMIPDCWKMNSQMFSLELSSNQLSGPIPNSFTNLSNLGLLSLSNNSLEGELPFFLDKLPHLVVLDVGKNNLHGEIPVWNGSGFSFFQVLILRENNFKGVIPQQLCSIQSLQVIDLANNALIGTIPHCFGLFKGMSQGQVSFYDNSPSFYEWSAFELIKGKKREYTTVLPLLVNMDLSCNNLVGAIPPNITSLSLLLGLNLSHNHLMGPIPKDIGNMKSLESLDLSCNNLSGSIPESISSINSLSIMNLSFNNLHGQIPTGSQLQTLDDPSIYMGNPGLCGDPLPKKCSNAHPPTSTVIEDEEEDNKLEKMWFYLVIMLGFATGFWGVIGILVAKMRWRHAFFQLAEDLADWLYIRLVPRVAPAKRG